MELPFRVLEIGVQSLSRSWRVAGFHCLGSDPILCPKLAISEQSPTIESLPLASDHGLGHEKKQGVIPLGDGTRRWLLGSRWLRYHPPTLLKLDSPIEKSLTSLSSWSVPKGCMWGIMTENNGHPVSDLPPSAKLVYIVLEHNLELTQKQIVEKTRLSPRTVRYALTHLESAGVIQKDVYFVDARQHIYSLTPDAFDLGG